MTNLKKWQQFANLGLLLSNIFSFPTPTSTGIKKRQSVCTSKYGLLLLSFYFFVHLFCLQFYLLFCLFYGSSALVCVILLVWPLLPECYNLILSLLHTHLFLCIYEIKTVSWHVPNSIVIEILILCIIAIAVLPKKVCVLFSNCL